MLIQNYEKLTLFIYKIQGSYVRLDKSLDVIVRMHRISSIGSLTKAKHKNQVQLVIDRYMEKLRREATNDDLELNTPNIHKHIDGPVMVKTMLHMLQDELDKGSKTIYPESMEARVRYQKYTIKQFWDIIVQY